MIFSNFLSNTKNTLGYAFRFVKRWKWKKAFWYVEWDCCRTCLIAYLRACVWLCHGLNDWIQWRFSAIPIMHAENLIHSSENQHSYRKIPLPTPPKYKYDLKPIRSSNKVKTFFAWFFWFTYRNIIGKLFYIPHPGKTY